MNRLKINHKIAIPVLLISAWLIWRSMDFRPKKEIYTGNIAHYQSIWPNFKLDNSMCGARYNCSVAYDANDDQIRDADVFIVHPVHTNLEGPGEEIDQAAVRRLEDRVNRLRYPSQVVIFQQSESPMFHHGEFSVFNNFFNGTLTYRPDGTDFEDENVELDESGRKSGRNNAFSMSDLTLPEVKLRAFFEYRRTLDNKEPSVPKGVTLDTITDKKLNTWFDNLNNRQDRNKGILGVISNCASEYRNELVEALRPNLKFPDGTLASDIRGKCYNDPIPGNFFDLLKIGRHYKFVLAFENSMCRHYITEKFFQNALMLGAVPIVAGAPRADIELKAPADSFIHVDDYENIGALIKHVNFLLADDRAYSKLHAWRKRDVKTAKYFPATIEDIQSNTAMCKLCRVAHEIRTARENNQLDENLLGPSFPPIKDFQQWWAGDQKYPGWEGMEPMCRPNKGEDYQIWKEDNHHWWKIE